MKPEKTPSKDFVEFRFDEVFKRLDRMEGKMDNFAFTKQSDFDSFKKHVSETYVTKEGFDPIKRVVYGLIGLILLGVGGAVMAGVVK